MKTIVIVVAMDKEITTIKNELCDVLTINIRNHHVYLGKFNDKTIILAKTGIGKVAASSFLTVLIERYHPDLVINMGIAGGFDVNLKTLDTIIVTKGVYSDVDMMEDQSNNLKYGQLENMPPYFSLDEKIFMKIKNILQDDVIYGMIATGDQFVTNYDKCREIVNKYDDYHILAFDMESTAFLQVCYEYSIPCIVIRTISDIIGSTSYFDYVKFSFLASIQAGNICKKILLNI